MKLAEVTGAFPELAALHGGTGKSFQVYLYRTVCAPGTWRSERRAGCGSGNRVDYELWQLRTVAIRLLVSRLLGMNASLDDRDLMNARWIPGRPVVELDLRDEATSCVATLTIVVPAALWDELMPS